MGKRNKSYGKDLSIEFEKLDESNRSLLKSFQCNNGTIDGYFRREAFQDKTATTYLFINREPREVIALATMHCSGIVDKSEEIYRNMIPAIEISYFATNDDYQGMSYSETRKDGTLSHQLLLFCIDYILRVPCSYCAASKLILYAVPNAERFYAGVGFSSFLPYMEEKNIPELKGCIPMYLDLV